MPTSASSSYYWYPVSNESTTSVANTYTFPETTTYISNAYPITVCDTHDDWIKKLFEYCREDEKEDEIVPVRLVRNNGATIVYWNDGTKTVVRLCKEDKQSGSDSNYTAFCIAVAKKIFGSNSAIHRLVKQIDDENIKAKAAAEAQKELERKRERERINHDRKVRRIAKELKIMDEANKLLVDEYERDKYE